MANKDVNQSSALILDPVLCVFKPHRCVFYFNGLVELCVPLFKGLSYYWIGFVVDSTYFNGVIDNTKCCSWSMVLSKHITLA